jgi:hypothetical protein
MQSNSEAALCTFQRLCCSPCRLGVCVTMTPLNTTPTAYHCFRLIPLGRRPNPIARRRRPGSSAGTNHRTDRDPPTEIASAASPSWVILGRVPRVLSAFFKLHFQKRYLGLKLCTLIEPNNVYILIIYRTF